MQNITLPNRIREVRSAHSLTLRELADKAGLSPAFVQKLETGARGLRVHSLRELAGAMNVPLADLLLQEDGGLGSDERALIEDYRTLDHHTRAVIANMMRGFNAPANPELPAAETDCDAA